MAAVAISQIQFDQSVKLGGNEINYLSTGSGKVSLSFDDVKQIFTITRTSDSESIQVPISNVLWYHL